MKVNKLDLIFIVVQFFLVGFSLGLIGCTIWMSETLPSINDEAAARYKRLEKILYPVVKIENATGGTSSGFTVKMPSGVFYVVSSAHGLFDIRLLRSVLKRKIPPEIPPPFKMTVVRGELSQTYAISPIYIDPGNDFAISTVDLSSTTPLSSRGTDTTLALYSANLQGKKTSARINFLDEVYVVGFPLGSDRRVASLGILSEANEKSIGFTAPMIYGNSGGPIFDAASGEVIGIAHKIAVTMVDGNIIPVTHIGFGIPIGVIKKALREVDSWN